MAIRLIGIFSLVGLLSNKLLASLDDPLLPGWGQLGLAGMLILAFFTDKIVTGAKYNQVVKERDEERARTQKAEDKLEEKFLPALLETQLALRTVNDQTLPLLNETREMLNELKAGKRGHGGETPRVT